MDERIRQRRMEIRASLMRRRRRWFMSGVAVVLLVAAAAATSRSSLFAVTEVRLTGVSGEQAAELRDLAPISQGENLLTLDLGRVEGRLRALPWLRSVHAVRVPPSTVELRVDVRQPVAVVRLAGAVWTVDADGVVLTPGAKPGLVEINAPNSVLLGVGTAVSDAAVRNALAVHAGLPLRWREAVDRYDAPSERGLRVHLVLADPQGGEQVSPGSSETTAGKTPPRGIWVRFGSAERSVDKARVLEALVEQVRRAPVAIAEIDVRAPGNPVLIPVSSGHVVNDLSQ